MAKKLKQCHFCFYMYIKNEQTFSLQLSDYGYVRPGCSQNPWLQPKDGLYNHQVLTVLICNNHTDTMSFKNLFTYSLIHPDLVQYRFSMLQYILKVY